MMKKVKFYTSDEAIYYHEIVFKKQLSKIKCIFHWLKDFGMDSLQQLYINKFGSSEKEVEFSEDELFNQIESARNNVNKYFFELYYRLFSEHIDEEVFDVYKMHN